MDVLSAEKLCQDSVDFLLEVWSPELGLFPYSTSVRGSAYVNDYRRPAADRYTVNTLLGLQQAASRWILGRSRSCRRSPTASSSADSSDLTSPADLGLLLVLLREDHDVVTYRRRGARPTAARRLEQVGGQTRPPDAQLGPLGAFSCCAIESEAEPGAHAVFRAISESFVDETSDLARHSVRLYRRWLVSFGSTVYFLRAMHEYAALTGDERAEALFENGVRKMVAQPGPERGMAVALQRPQGRPDRVLPGLRGASGRDGDALPLAGARSRDGRG